MITYFIRKKKTLTHIQNSMARLTHKSHSHLPGRQTEGREEKSFERKKVLFLSAGINPASFTLLFIFSPFHEISWDITGSSNSINAHSQPVH